MHERINQSPVEYLILLVPALIFKEKPLFYVHLGFLFLFQVPCYSAEIESSPFTNTRMSTPMEISEQNPTDANASEQNAAITEQVASAPAPVIAEEKFIVSGTLRPHIHTCYMQVKLELFDVFVNLFFAVEVCLKPSSTARIEDVRSAVEKYFHPYTHSSHSKHIASFSVYWLQLTN